MNKVTDFVPLVVSPQEKEVFDLAMKYTKAWKAWCKRSDSARREKLLQAEIALLSALQK